ncbi:MAG TPA: DUF3775 domain-containing protein [Gemmataceae bacterium]|nr:DUF3775 domain-containing protein [Gemmataceae bacterium]
MKLSEVIAEVIRLGEASRAYWDRELPRRHPHYPIIRPHEVAAPAPPEDAQIQSLLKKLPEDQLYALLLLTYLGRGDVNANHLLPAYQSMKATFTQRDLVIAQLMGNKALAEYLTDALDELRKHRIDLNSLQFGGAAVVS